MACNWERVDVARGTPTFNAGSDGGFARKVRRALIGEVVPKACSTGCCVKQALTRTLIASGKMAQRVQAV